MRVTNVVIFDDLVEETELGVDSGSGAEVEVKVVGVFELLERVEEVIKAVGMGVDRGDDINEVMIGVGVADVDSSGVDDNNGVEDSNGIDDSSDVALVFVVKKRSI